MKKILIILVLTFSFSAVAQALSLNEIFAKKTLQLPEFSVVDMQGKTHNNSSVKGKYLVVNFWATWCPPCLREIPTFVEFYEKNSDRVEILGMNHEQVNKAKIQEFSDAYMVNYPIILSDNNNRPMFNKFGEILGMPTTFIYAPDGSLINYLMGEIDQKNLESAIDIN
jgi:thiol-disulfide isomerase/thioredoxin